MVGIGLMWISRHVGYLRNSCFCRLLERAAEPDGCKHERLHTQTEVRARVNMDWYARTWPLSDLDTRGARRGSRFPVTQTRMQSLAHCRKHEQNSSRACASKKVAAQCPHFLSVRPPPGDAGVAVLRCHRQLQLGSAARRQLWEFRKARPCAARCLPARFQRTALSTISQKPWGWPPGVMQQ